MSPAADQKAVVRELRNYLAGQVVGITRDESLLDELLKCAFCHRELRGNGPLEGDAEQVALAYRAAFGQIRGRLPDLFGESAELLLSPAHIARVHAALCAIDFDLPGRDIVGDIYEAFVGPIFRGQEGQFFTPTNAVDVLVALTDPRPSDTLIDPACGAGSFLMRAALHSIASSGAAPAISGVDKDAYLARLARIHLALQLGGDPSSVVCADSLAWDEHAADSLPGEGGYSLVLTNPPFGARIVALTGDARADFDLARKWKFDRASARYLRTEHFAANAPPQVLFAERCLRLLAPGGRLGIVMPESTLSNPRHRHMVQYILDRATPEAVVGMPEALFKTSGKGGTHTKVCLVVLRKAPPSGDARVFMADVKWCGHDSRGRAIERDELPAVVERFRAHRAGGPPSEEDHLGFSVPLRDIRDFILAPRYYNPEPRRATRALSRSHELVRVGALVESGQVKLSTGHEVGKLAYGEGDVPFVRTSDLAGWEIKVDPKHLVSQATYDALAPKQDVREGDLLMVRDGTYLIGTCAYVTKHDTRIVFQSHLYKLRVEPDGLIDRFLLLAALSSPPVRAQIRSLSFTQDIIDSLGDRVRDVVLPLPRDPARREEISSLVRTVIHDRVEARELARKAVLEIAQPG